jgi:hypothetical protein
VLFGFALRSAKLPIKFRWLSPIHDISKGEKMPKPYHTPKSERDETAGALSEQEQTDECFCEGDHCEWDPEKGTKALAFLEWSRER